MAIKSNKAVKISQKHLLGIQDLSISDVNFILNEAKQFINSNDIKSVHLFRMNIFKLFFEENTFDVIISNGVLHHTYNPKLAFSKLVRVLKPRGIIVIGLYHRYGRIIQKIRQSLIKNFGDSFNFLDKRFREKKVNLINEI